MTNGLEDYGGIQDKAIEIRRMKYNQVIQLIGTSYLQEHLIDVYEWVETTLTPLAPQADTEEGPKKEISGIRRHICKYLYRYKKFDSVGKEFCNKYYYWVKNTKIIP